MLIQVHTTQLILYQVSIRVMIYNGIIIVPPMNNNLKFLLFYHVMYNGYLNTPVVGCNVEI